MHINNAEVAASAATLAITTSEFLARWQKAFGPEFVAIDGSVWVPPVARLLDGIEDLMALDVSR